VKLGVARESDRSHTEVQGWLRDLGHALGLEVWIAAAFEVEHTTSIYSGLVRLLDLALGVEGGLDIRGLFLVAPDNREDEVRQQLRRPAFRRVADLDVRYLPYGELDRHREAMARFGEGLKAIEAIARRLV
jgi:type II restriction enzyme